MSIIKVTSLGWLLPARYMKMEHQMMENTILRTTGHLGKRVVYDLKVEIV